MKIIILGNGAEVPNIIEIINSRPDLSIAGILDDAPDNPSGHDSRILGRLSDAVKYKNHGFVWGIHGMHNRFLRLQLETERNISPDKFVTLIHPAATVSSTATLGHGVIIQAGTVICCNVKIGANSYVSPNCVIGHDTVLGHGNILAAGVMLAGKIEIGTANYIGMGACVKERLIVGHGNIIGMAAAVIRNVTDGNTMVGVPAVCIATTPLPELFSTWINKSNCNDGKS